MIELTSQQHEALPSGTDPVPVIDPASNVEYVLLRKEVFERMQELLFDDSPWTDEEMDLLHEEAAEMLDNFGKTS